MRKQPEMNHNRRRHAIWFNPPFSANVTTNVGGRFLKIIDKCFPPTNPLNKIINRNKVKMAYKKMPYMKEIIGRHNMEVTRNGNVPQYPLGCNCRGGWVCAPLTWGVMFNPWCYLWSHSQNLRWKPPWNIYRVNCWTL